MADDTDDTTYIIRGGRAGRERLRVLGRVLAPTTAALFERVGVAPTARCLDAGCGGGDVTAQLAGLATEGEVTGVDIDGTKLDLAREEAALAGRTNVAFVAHDVTASPPIGTFDVIYARFLLTHLPDPAATVANLAAALAPGGVLVVEDIDFRGHFCEPPSTAFDRFVELYTRTAQARGADPHIGPRLPGLLAAAGLGDGGMHVVQPAGTTGEVKLIAPLTLEAIGASAVAAGLTTDAELAHTLATLQTQAADPTHITSLPRIVQSWAHRPGPQPPP